MKSDEDTDATVAIAHQELRVGKKIVNKGRVRVQTRVVEHPAWVREELAREDVEVERVDIGREIDSIPEVRTEGDTLIIPLFEEVLVVEKRLVLRQELRLTRRMVTRTHEQEVRLRSLEAGLERIGRQGDVERQQPPRSGGPPMTRTITALYDTRQDAERAREQLISSGFSPSDVSLSGQGASAASADEHRGFFQGIKDFFAPDEDRHAYSEAIRRGHVLLTLRAAEGQDDSAIQVLDGTNAVDLDTRQAEWRQSGWRGYEEARLSGGAAEEATIPIAEERLRVGKREVDRGSVRVRSYVVEEPVHEQVSLRDEHIDVERRPVNERVPGSTEGLFEERSFDVAERGEEAVVGKETVITDELQVRKSVEEHTEDIDDTVRRTEVDVDDERARKLGRDRDEDAHRRL